MCHFVLVFFSPFSIAITSLGEERANLSAFRTFVRFVLVITKTRLYNFDPLLYSKTGVYRGMHYFLNSAQNIDCGYSLEPPRRGGSNEYLNLCFEQKAEAVLTSTHNLCFEQKYEKYQSFLSENFQFLEVKFSIHLNRHVFVMFRFVGFLFLLGSGKGCGL